VRGGLTNCILYLNTAEYGSNYYADLVDYFLNLNHCCTTPLPSNGVGNIAQVPLLVDVAHGDLRLQSNSPCINAGNNSDVSNTDDLDGNPRIIGGTVDIGAYEYQNPTSLISYAWLQQYGLSADGSADFADPGHDGMNNWQEWRCSTDPTNPNSALRLLPAAVTSTNVTVSWQSIAGVDYFVERSTKLAPPLSFVPVASGIAGQSGVTTYVDTNLTGFASVFYRVGVVP
jgi:hypothetical protein